MSEYPRWRYFPSYAPPAPWVATLVGVFRECRSAIDAIVDHEQRMESDAVLKVLAPGLADLGFVIELGKVKTSKLPRPVLFGDEGKYLRTYEIDAFQPADGVALEVEAGRATMGNAIYRDLVQASLMVDARFLALAVPVEYRYRTGTRTAKEPSYAKTYSVVEAIYSSPRLTLPFDGLLLVGY